MTVGWGDLMVLHSTIQRIPVIKHKGVFDIFYTGLIAFNISTNTCILSLTVQFLFLLLHIKGPTVVEVSSDREEIFKLYQNNYTA